VAYALLLPDSSQTSALLIMAFAKFKATSHNRDSLMFAVVALEHTVAACRSHKHPHKPSIDRATASLVLLRHLLERCESVFVAGSLS